MTILSPIYCAIDVADAEAAYQMARKVAPHVSGLKLGLEYFIENGADGVRRMQDLGKPVFLDLKLHDIPATVAAGVKAIRRIGGVKFTTIHISGASEMMKAALDAAGTDVKLLGVTVLTSLSNDDLRETGHNGGAAAQVLRRTRLAMQSGLAGIVCSPHEVGKVRAASRKYGRPDLVLMVPGIRPVDTGMQDQKRVATPQKAIDDGASFLVIGRPITAATDPAAAAEAINRSLANVLQPGPHKASARPALG